jgi:DNA-directed RNA polymerase specialized sigma24 family protein
MGEELEHLISRKLSALIALAMLPEVNKKNAAEKVAILMRFDLPNQEIADIVGTTKGTVEVLKSRAGKKRK